MEENKTLLTFSISNGSVQFKQELEGVPNEDILKLCGLMDMAKNNILKDISDKSEVME